MPQPHLAIVDADRVHEYVFSPRELKLIRGGSSLQTELNRDILPRIARSYGGDVLTDYGGTVLASFPDGPLARDFCQGADLEFLRETCGATVTTACSPYSDATFGADRRNLISQQLEYKKRSAKRARFSGAQPWCVVCGACGLFPAVEEIDEELRCAACRKRRQKSHRFGNPPESFEQLAALSRPENYLAIVYIDLDRLGRHLDDRIHCKEDCLKLGKATDRAVRESVYSAYKSLPPEDPDPYETLLAGGDDAVIALPASSVFQFLRGFRDQFDEHRRAADLPFFSAGVLIAHSHFPIAEFVRLAEDALRSAKSVKCAHSVHFAVLTASLADELSVHGGNRGTTANPYRLDEFLEMTRQMRDLKTVEAPTSKIHDLYRLAQEGHLRGEIEYQYLLTRLEPSHADKLSHLVGENLWRAEDGRTFAADIAELWDFIHA
jgi:hypothetical protein